MPHGGGSTSRLKRVALSQVGVYAAYAHVEQGLWTWVDAELYLPEAWFDDAHTEQRQRLEGSRAATLRDQSQSGLADGLPALGAGPA